jgi:geranylgeranyl diphosphate synthase type II
MHDDIMDKSFVRRGSQTVHEKWDTNTAILSGDAMLVQAYGCLNEYEPILYKKLTTLFSKTALEVCEGQQFDVDYESLSDVNIKSYLEMIRLKTAVLVGASMKMGALIGGANENEANKLYDFGEKLGIAFQLQDDYLDTFGNGTKFGKRIGGDIVENKKTILVHMLNQTGNKEQRNALQDWLSSKPKNESQKIAAVTKLFKSAKADISTLDYVQDYTNQAFAALDELLIKRESKKSFISFGNWLMNRTN